MFITQSFLANLKLKELHIKRTIRRPMYTVSTYCVLLATVLTAVATESSPQNVLTCDLANLGLDAVHAKSHGAMQRARYSVVPLFPKLRGLTESGSPWFLGVAPQG